ncbi:LemA family protein [bacterium]|nr:LemA family protein [bacterium]
MAWKIILAIFVLFILWLIFIYNNLVRRRIRINEAWSDIEVQLKRRYNLIPNLVNTVKGYASHEKNVLERITSLRAQTSQVQNKKQRMEIENNLSNTLKTLFALAENYPELKANQNFLELQNELSDTEDKIQAARRFYNSVVKDYNTSIEIFPQRILARIFKFKPAEFFRTQEKEKQTPEVNF